MADGHAPMAASWSEMPPLAVLFLISLLSIQVFSEEVQISGQFSVGEESAFDGPVQESPLFNLPSMRVAREYLRRQAGKEEEVKRN